MEAVDRGNGHIEFKKAIGNFAESKPSTNTVDVTFKIKAGSVTHYNNDRTYFHGINWNNVKAVSGQTYDLRSEIKEKGFKWDGKNKRWVR